MLRANILKPSAAKFHIIIYKYKIISGIREKQEYNIKPMLSLTLPLMITDKTLHMFGIR